MARAPERAMPATRLSRSALFAFAAASVGAASCGGDVNTETSKTRVNEDAAVNGGSSSSGGQLGVPFYGAPFPAGGTNGAGGTGGQLGIAPYGAPFPTGGANGAGGDTVVPPYGIPPFTGGTTSTDAGNDDAAVGGAGGTFGAPHYGGPPR